MNEIEVVAMNPCELAAFVSAAAIAIAKNTPDDEELGVLALAFRQLADTLGTIAAQRVLLAEKEQKKENSPQPSNRDPALIRPLIPGGFLD